MNYEELFEEQFVPKSVLVSRKQGIEKEIINIVKFSWIFCSSNSKLVIFRLRPVKI